MTPISITVTGADGRMGKMILEAAAAASDITVAAALVPSEALLWAARSRHKAHLHP